MPTLTDTPCTKAKIIFPMNEDSLHDSGIIREYLPVCEQLLHSKAVYLCGFCCGCHGQSRATLCTHTCKEHLNTILGCPVVGIVCGPLMHGPNTFTLATPVFLCLYYWVVELWKIFMAPQVILTWRMPSDTLNSVTGHTDLILWGESSLSKI